MPTHLISSQNKLLSGDVVQFGNQANSMVQNWAQLTDVLGQVGTHPESVEHRIVLIKVFIGLGLSTLARREFDRLDDMSDSGATEGFAQQITAMPDDRILPDEREATLRTNLARLDMQYIPPDQIMDWRSRFGDTSWYRAIDGNVVRHNESTNRFAHLGDLSSLHLRQLEPIREKMGERGMAPILLEGVDPPWMLKSLVDAPPPERSPTFRQRVLVLQSDWNELFDGLACVDLGDGVGDPRFEWFIGEGASDRLLAWVDVRLDDAPPSTAIECPTVRTKSSPDVHGLMREIDARWVRNANELSLKMNNRPERDQRWWAQRYSDANAGGEPLRVLIPVSRYTTYLKYAAKDLAASFKALGCEPWVLMETDDSSLMSSCTTLRAIDEFDPDLILSINYTRSALGKDVPRDIPHVCWIQDAMAHLFDRKIGESLGMSDFIVGMVKPELIEKFGYPEERMRWMPMVVSQSKFSAHPISEGFDSEIAWVTHQSEHPDVFRQRMIEKMEENAPDAAPKFASALEEIEDIVTSQPHAFLFAEVYRVVDRSFFPSGVPLQAEMLRSNIINTMVIPYAERVFRHQAAQWAANISMRRGWRFKLYGNGWEDHPQLGAFAAGGLEHGDALRECYRNSVVHLHASVNQVTHQRISECLLSGGLPLCRVVRDSFSLIWMQILDHCHREGIGEPAEMLPGEVDRWRVEIDSSKSLQKLVDDLARLDLCSGSEYAEDSLTWKTESFPNAIARMKSPSERKNAEMFASMTNIFFTNESQLESLIERAINDHPWRNDRIVSGIANLPQELTYDGFASEVLDLVTSKLNQDE